MHKSTAGTCDIVASKHDIEILAAQIPEAYMPLEHVTDLGGFKPIAFKISNQPIP